MKGKKITTTINGWMSPRNGLEYEQFWSHSGTHTHTQTYTYTSLWEFAIKKKKQSEMK